jgi:lysophospholipid acyltransferase (LPLAT)-like uncharacterized protein
LKKALRSVLRSRWMQRVASFGAAESLRLVWLTNKFSFDPQDIYQQVDRNEPVIVTFWHGHHFLVPFLRRGHRFGVLISRHRDGEINALAARRLGIELVRGSGDHGNSAQRKGGMPAFLSMMRALRDNINMSLTADVPKVSRVAGPGIILLARESGRPIMPIAIATSRFRRLNNWDRSVIHLPFGRGALVCGELLIVPADADADTMERFRVQLETSLNESTRRAYAMVGRTEDGGHVV